MAKKFEYIIRRVEAGKYEVRKFDPDTLNGGGQPLALYNVVYDPPRKLGRCDCPAATYRGTGNVDKHVQIVQQWIAAGEQSSIVV